ncbi:MAG: TlyA family RNA methyltransferase [Nannocystaceae bacterium]|nr:TlyA family RNA methyltransferase [Nannocystaceae bacterium]
MAARERIDRLLVARGLAESRTRAQALVIAGQVLVDGTRVDKPGSMVPLTASLQVKGRDHPFVSRGGAKLQGALLHFGARTEPPVLTLAQRVAMDVGASTGGFTDCLLQHGVARVHAVDVGYGQLAWKLATDPRVVVHDRCNIRTLSPEVIGEPIALCVIDCSFIALAKVLPHVPAFLGDDADVIALVKPQFELDPARVGKGGIVRDDGDRREALDSAEAAAAACGMVVVAHCESVLEGKTGNREWFTWLRWTRGEPGRTIAPP